MTDVENSALLRDVSARLRDAIMAEKMPQDLQDAIGAAYVELGKIYNFKTMRRWVNIFNINPISIERIDFTKKKGNVKGIDLDNISKAFLDSDLFKYKPSKNNS